MVLYEKVFETEREDGKNYWFEIWAVVDMEHETVEFKVNEKRYTRKLKRKNGKIGFVFEGLFYSRKDWMDGK